MSRQVSPVSLVRPRVETPGLEGLNRAGRRLARGLGEYLTSLLSLPTAVTALPAMEEASAASPQGSPASAASPQGSAAARAIRLPPLPGAMLLLIGQAAAARLADRHYGGDGAEGPADEALTPAADRLVDRIAQGLCGLLPTAWRPLAPIAAELQVDAGELEPGAAARQTFTIACEGWSEFSIDCLWPLAMLDAVPALSGAAAASTAGDANWQARLMDSALQVPFRVRAVFAEPELQLADLLALSPGDLIPICLPSAISLRIDGAVVASGAAGESNGRAAVRIERI